MEKLLTTQEVAEVLNCHPNSVYKNKELPYMDIPGVGKRYKKLDLEEFFAQKTIKPRSLLACKNPLKSFNLTNLDEFDKLLLKGESTLSNKGSKYWNYKGIGAVYIKGKTKQGKESWYMWYCDEEGKRR